MLREAMPALLLLALLQATQPALARGLVPVCTTTGTDWIDPADGRQAPVRDAGPICLHGWCTLRRSRTG
jgi:hypothetical protein